jgi:hypothetical protein
VESRLKADHHRGVKTRLMAVATERLVRRKKEETLPFKWRVGRTKAQQRRITATVSKKRSRGGARAANVRNPI